MAEIDIDLDALIPEAKVVKFGGNLITIQPPTTEQLLSLVKLGERLKNNYSSTAEGELYQEGIAKDFNDLQDSIAGLAPELKGAKLNFAQIVALLEMIVEMAMPGQLEELKKRGITIDSPKEPAGS